MKFKTDENLPEEAAELLRSAGYDAVTVAEQGIGGEPDPDLASICQQEQRALVTLDLGFSDIRAYPPEEYHGLVVLRLKRQDKAHVVEMLERLVPVLETEALASRLWIVEEERIRIRS